jgi:hypothetical protein
MKVTLEPVVCTKFDIYVFIFIKWLNFWITLIQSVRAFVCIVKIIKWYVECGNGVTYFFFLCSFLVILYYKIVMSNRDQQTRKPDPFKGVSLEPVVCTKFDIKFSAHDRF